MHIVQIIDTLALVQTAADAYNVLRPREVALV